MRYPDIVDALRKTITSGELAALTGVTRRQVHRWASGESRPERPARTHLLNLKYITERLSEGFTDEGIQIWLHSRNERLGWMSPYDLLLAGQWGAVCDVAIGAVVEVRAERARAAS